MTIKAPAEDSSLDFEAAEKICKREELFREISANFSWKSKDLTIFSRRDIGDLQQINRYESSANENDIVLHRGESVFKDERRSEVARMKRIGESEPPCGTPLEIFE